MFQLRKDFNTNPWLINKKRNGSGSLLSFQTPAEQAQARMKMALKAAAMADGKLKEQAGFTQSMDPIDSRNFTDAVALIESDGFVPTAFKSSRASRSYKVQQNTIA